MIIFLGFFFLTSTKVFAFLEEYTPEEWYNHITQFDEGYAYGFLVHTHLEGENFVIRVMAEPSGDIFLDDVVYGNEDLIYFEPQLRDAILHWIDNDFYDGYYEYDLAGEEFVVALENTIGLTNYSGYLYWNFEEQYWQIEYYNSSDYIEEEEFTFKYVFTEFIESGNPELIRIYFTYPIIVFEDTEIPIEIWFHTASSATDTIESISFYDQQFDVSITEDERYTVNFFVDSDYVSNKIRLTFLEYTCGGTLKSKNITIDMPVFVYSSKVDYYKYLFDRGYNEGYDDGLADGGLAGDYQEGYQEGYQDGYDDGLLAGDYQEGYQEGYQDGFIAGEKSKIAKNNESFYNNIAIWVPAVITLVALASIISYFGLKKKE